MSTSGDRTQHTRAEGLVTPERVAVVAQLYLDRARFDGLSHLPSPFKSRIVNCCQRLIEFIAEAEDTRLDEHAEVREDGKLLVQKAHRWLGFVQGLLWANDVYTIDELRLHNSPPPPRLEADVIKQMRDRS